MAVEVLVPEIGEEIEEATISCWHFRTGDIIEQGQDLVELATDKATFNIASPGEGILTQVYYEEGDKVDVGEVIALIENQENLINEDEEDDQEEEE